MNSEMAEISGKAAAMESLIKSAVEKEIPLPKKLVKPAFDIFPGVAVERQFPQDF